jgi:hypothetical protein
MSNIEMKVSVSIEDIVEEIIGNTESLDFYESKYPGFSSNYPVLSEKLFEKDLDKDTLKYLLNEKQKIAQNKTTQHDASIKVGSLLVDRYVKPLVKE